MQMYRRKKNTQELYNNQTILTLIIERVPPTFTPEKKKEKEIKLILSFSSFHYYPNILTMVSCVHRKGQSCLEFYCYQPMEKL